MPANIVGPTELEFAIDEDELALVTQKVSVKHGADKKAARDKGGDVVCMAYYNQTSEVDITGHGIYDETIGTAAALVGDYGTLASSALLIEEITVDKANEEYATSNVKAMAYVGIPGA